MQFGHHIIIYKLIDFIWKQKLFIQENTLLNRKLIGAKST